MADTNRTFDKKLYRHAAIKEAVAAYEDFATLTIDRTSTAWTVNFSDVDEDFGAEVIANEFANYVLARTVQESR